ncbi:MAG: hypothetical protein H7338_22260 [Candidatus Sericytochromatia bacterium]|nr:hypothetical protein [Candidatus Sericytochromatia bacterium]
MSNLAARTPIEQALWASGHLDSERQAKVDRLCRGIGAPPVSGNAFLFDPETYQLTIGSPYFPMLNRQIALPKPSGAYIPGHPVGQPKVALFGADFQRLEDFRLDDVCGILVSGGLPFRYAEAFQPPPRVAFGHTALVNAHAGPGSAWGPVDLALVPAGDLALISDRGLGAIFVVDLKTGILKHTLNLREPGGVSAMPTACLGDRLLVANPAGQELVSFDVRTGQVQMVLRDLGTVSHVLATPDGRYFCVLSTAPWFGVHLLDPRTLESVGTIALMGAPFSRWGDPCDLMAVAPDSQHLLVMSAIQDPEPRTPQITVIDLGARLTVRRVQLRASRKPAGLAFAVENPFCRERFTIEESLIELGYLTPDEVLELVVSLDTDAPLPARVVAQFEAPPGLGDKAGGQGHWRRNDLSAAAPMEIPAAVEKLIAEAVQRRCAELGDADVRQDATAWARVEAAAAEARTQLLTCAATEVVLSELTPNGGLRVLITREQVLEWLQILAQLDTVLQDAEADFLRHLEALPEDCPDCGTALFGSYTCPSCGIDVIAVMQQHQLHVTIIRKQVSAATVAECLFLPPGHLLLADAARQRVVELDQSGAIIWQLQADREDDTLQQLLQTPVDALRLANGHSLILDRTARRLFEVTREGRPYWEWPEAAGVLIEPVRVARSEWGETLVVDRQAHCIRRVDATGRPMIPYGGGAPGIGPGELCLPTDVHVLPNEHQIITDGGNNRVIEVAFGQLIWQFGNPANVLRGGGGDGATSLANPRRAYRLSSGKTVILDAGNHRIVIVDRFGQISWEFDTLALPAELAMANPLGMARLDGGHLVYWDQHRIVQIDGDGRIAWGAGLATLDLNPRLLTEGDGGDADQPRRLWAVQRLADTDPEAIATQMAIRALEASARAVKKALLDGRQAECIRLLKEESARRLQAFREHRVWKLDMAAVRQHCDGIRAELRARVSPGTAARATGAGDVGGEALSLKATETLGLDRPPIQLLVTLKRNNTVVWIDRKHDVRWVWGEGKLDKPQSAELHDGTCVLITDLGNNRIVDVETRSNEIIWQTHPRLGLSSPRAAVRLANGNTLIADAGNHRLIEVAPDQELVWEWQDPTGLGLPTSCQRLSDGSTLMADWSNHVVLEIAPDNAVAWRYGMPRTLGDAPGMLNFPEHAVRLENGHTLIADGRNDRVIEVSRDGRIAWEYRGKDWRRVSLPSRVTRLADGATLITQGSGRLIIEIAPAGHLLWRATLGNDIARTRLAR